MSAAEAADPNWQGPHWAGVYDSTYPPLSQEDPQLQFLLGILPEAADLLEIGIGTGRVALPLAKAGRRVFGVDISGEMLHVLLAKPEAKQLLGTECSSAADLALDCSFGGAYMVFNTLFAMLSLEEQRRCLRAVATHLHPGAKLVIENSNPLLNFSALSENGGWATKEVTAETTRVIAGCIDKVTQTIQLAHLIIRSDRIDRLPAHVRYTFKSELELMAELSGFTVHATFGDWNQEPYSSKSPRLIMVLERTHSAK